MCTWLMGGAIALAVGSAPLAAGGPAREERGPRSHHLVSVIDTEDFGAETVRIGDLNGDGAPDLLFVQSIHATREITCLTATTVSGEVLWQHGTPSRDNGVIYSDLPVQIYDWDGDGANEVLYVVQARYVEPDEWGGWARERARSYEGDAFMVILDAATGEEKGRFAIPAPADDCFLFANLTGRGRRQDLVVKDRYWNIWGVSHEGTVLWHWEGSTGHFPAYGDVDDDGKDEIFLGFCLLDHDGTVRFAHDPKGAHQDAAYVVRLEDGTWRLLFGNHGLHCLSIAGEELWSLPMAEAQHVVIARYRGDGPLQCAAIARGQPRPDGSRDPATLILCDMKGQELWHRELGPESWASGCIAVDWFGADDPSCVLVYGRGPGEPAVLYDGGGELVDSLPMVYAPGHPDNDPRAHFYALKADVWGDGRDEVILFGARGACIYSNARPLAIPTLYNSNLYPGM